MGFSNGYDSGYDDGFADGVKSVQPSGNSGTGGRQPSGGPSSSSNLPSGPYQSFETVDVTPADGAVQLDNAALNRVSQTLDVVRTKHGHWETQPATPDADGQDGPPEDSYPEKDPVSNTWSLVLPAGSGSTLPDSYDLRFEDELYEDECRTKLIGYWLEYAYTLRDTQELRVSSVSGDGPWNVMIESRFDVEVTQQDLTNGTPDGISAMGGAVRVFFPPGSSVPLDGDYVTCEITLDIEFMSNYYFEPDTFGSASASVKFPVAASGTSRNFLAQVQVSCPGGDSLPFASVFDVPSGATLHGSGANGGPADLASSTANGSPVNFVAVTELSPDQFAVMVTSVPQSAVSAE